MNKDDVVQFNENHKWCGALGIIREVKDYVEEPHMVRYMVGVLCPMQGTAFIYATESEFEYIGRAVMIPKEEE